MSADPNRDRTPLFQALERELLGAGAASLGSGNALSEAETQLQPHFEHRDRLQQALGAGSLTYEAFFLRAKRSEPWVTNTINSILTEARAARSQNSSLCLKTWAEWMVPTNRAISNVAATAMLQGYKQNLEPALMVKSCLRDSGDILEGSVQPFVRLRLQMLEIGGSRKPGKKAVEQLAFGEAIDELVKISANGQIYIPLPTGIPISQWRNIANHNSYETAGNCVTCSYGPPAKRTQLQCTPTDILALACYFNDLCYAHKAAIEIFGIDNMAEMRPWLPNIDVSEYTKHTALAFGLVDHGFSVRLALQKGDKWKLILTDQHARDARAAKTALQKACISFALMNDSAHLEADVHSTGGTHRFSFKVSFQSKHEPPPTGFLGDVRRLDHNFRFSDESTPL